MHRINDRNIVLHTLGLVSYSSKGTEPFPFLDTHLFKGTSVSL